MQDLISIVRANDTVDHRTAIEVLEVLVPIVEAVPRDEEADEAVSRLIGRIDPAGPLQAAADWWFTVMTGMQTPTGLAYRLPDEFGEAAPSMVQLLELKTDLLSAAERFEKLVQLDTLLEELDDKLRLDSYGISKLPGERPVWDWLVNELRDVIDQVRAGVGAAAVELDVRGFEAAKKAEDIHQGSLRWRELRRRADELVAYLAACSQLQRECSPNALHARPRRVAQVPALVAETIGPLAARLLRPVIDPVRVPPSEDEFAFLNAAIATAAAGTDAKGQSLLATIVDSWIAETGARVPPMNSIIERQEQIRARIDELRAAGLDTDEAELHLIDHDLSAAEAAVATLTTNSKQKRRLEGARMELRHFAQKITDSEFAGDADWRERLQQLEVLAGSADPDALRAAVANEERAFEHQRRSGILDAARVQLEVLRALGPTVAVIAAFDDELSALRADETRKIPLDFLSRIAERTEEFAAQLEQGVAAALDECRRVLDAAAHELSIDERHAFSSRLDVLADRLDVGTRDGQLLDDAERLRTDIAGARARRWTAAEGEEELLRHINDFCRARLDFAPGDIERLHTAIKTKPFVVLAGLTGTGKSSLARLYAEATGATAQNGRFLRVAVRPDWIDQADVLGYINPVSERFVPGWFAEVVRSCNGEPDRLFFVLLDEMNLAPVEQYFAEYLSAIEEMRSGGADVRVPLYQRGALPVNNDEWPADLRFPPNLVVIGTVNVDESSRPLSDRVLDRASTLQLSLETSDRHHAPRGTPHRPWIVPYSEWRKICVEEPDADHHDLLIDIAQLLKPCGIGVGIRTHIEIERFVANGATTMGSIEALDWAIVHRIIPKIRGYRGALMSHLEQLRERITATGLEHSTHVLDGWIESGSDDDFIDGSDHRVGLMQ